MTLRVLKQSAYAQDDFNEGDLNLHMRPTGKSHAVVVFIHGLGGSGYRTWQKFLPLAYADESTSLDIAVYDYKSGLRGAFGNQGGFQGWTSQLLEQLRDLADSYKTIVLVGHSQGGVIAEEIALQVWDRHDPDPLAKRIAGLILLGSPRAGSMLVNSLTVRLIPSLYPLRARGDVAKKHDLFFSGVERMNLAEAEMLGKPVIPVYVGYGNRDCAVDQFSATSGVVQDQRRQFSVRHRELAKPKDEESEIFKWWKRVTYEIIDSHLQRARTVAHSAAHIARGGKQAKVGKWLSTKMLTDATGFVYREIYNEVLEAASSADMPILDCEDGDATDIDLVVGAHHASRVNAGADSVRGKIDQVCSMRRSGRARMAIVHPVGEGHTAASKKAVAWVEESGPSPDALYVEGVASIKELRTKMQLSVKQELERKRARQSVRLDNYFTSTQGGWLGND